MLTEPDPVKYFIAVLSPLALPCWDALLDKVTTHCGPVDFVTAPVRFLVSRYYEEEMGADLWRRFISLERLMSPGILADMKRWTMIAEEQFAAAGHRVVNLDPGYLDYNKMVLASTKFNGQKIYLEKGIYADLTLFYFKGRFDSFPWTFPDFRDGAYETEMRAMRERYCAQRRGTPLVE
ncbi:DUF4416 family protein [bacterium]|nr:DUF4416 family protein [candidate division CSSED10-310 bacterium]